MWSQSHNVTTDSRGRAIIVEALARHVVTRKQANAQVEVKWTRWKRIERTSEYEKYDMTISYIWGIRLSDIQLH